jgi:lipoprotein-releasing system ATP-binding protein
MLIDLKNVTKVYSGRRMPILDNITLSITEGSSVAVLGPSGSGKSTLLNLLGTLDFPTSGEVLFDRTPTAGLSPDELALMRNNKIGFVFQTHLLLPQLTVLENVLLPVITGDRNRRDLAVKKARELLMVVGLSDRTNNYPGEMSVGECQRVAVVRALINEPELLLADEPTGSLDHDSAGILGDMLIDLKKNHFFTLITVTHSMDLAVRMETIYRLVNGKIFNRELKS